MIVIDEDYDWDDTCPACGGAGYVPCPDWPECTRAHAHSGPGQQCRCPTCHGLGIHPC